MYTQTKKTTVLINGVSIASLCLALGLAQDEIPFVIVDENQSWKKKDHLILLYPATIAQLRKLDVWSLISEDVQTINGVNYFTQNSDSYIYSMNLQEEVVSPCLIETKTLMMALIDILDEYDQKIHWNTSLLDYKNKKTSSVCTLHDTKEKFLCEATYIVAAKNRTNSLILESSIRTEDIGKPLYMREARFSHINLSRATIEEGDIQEQGEGTEQKNKQEVPPTKFELKNKHVDEGDINIMTMHNQTLAVTDFFGEVVIQFTTAELLGEGELEERFEKVLALAFAKLGKKVPEVEITDSESYQAYTSNILQYYNMFSLGRASNGYISSHHTINQACADAENLAWKIIAATNFPGAKHLPKSYGDERIISHKTDHKVTQSVAGSMYRSGVAGVFSGIQNRFALLNKGFQKKLRCQYLGTHDEYPESRICVEEYPSLKQMAPWNKSTDVTWLDGLKFFRGPKAGFQAPHGYLVFESNQPKQNRRDLLTNGRHLLLIFDGINSSFDNMDEIRDELAEKYRSFLDCYRITKSYDISKHDEDTRVFGDADALFHKAYKAQRASFYLIRPDGVIGFRCIGLLEDKLEKYIETIIGDLPNSEKIKESTRD